SRPDAPGRAGLAPTTGSFPRVIQTTPEAEHGIIGRHEWVLCERNLSQINELIHVDVSLDRWSGEPETSPAGGSRAAPTERGPMVANEPGREGVQYLQAVADVMRHLADGTRLRLLLALAARGEQNVNQLCEALSAAQPAVS